MQKGEKLRIRIVNSSKQQEKHHEVFEMLFAVAFMDFWRDEHFLSGTIREGLKNI
jgi:hypothetical protein